MNNPNATKNLKPFKAGKDERRNYKGRPKLPDLKAAIAKVLAEEKDGMDALEAILKAQRAKAAKGDTRAAEFLMDRGYGKAQQFMDLTSGGERLRPVFQVIDKTDAESLNKLHGGTDKQND
jgi:hypothetical protein